MPPCMSWDFCRGRLHDARHIVCRTFPRKRQEKPLNRSGYEPDFPLTPDREHADLVAGNEVPVERDVPGLAERDHEFADVAVRSPADQRGICRLPSPRLRPGAALVACQSLDPGVHVLRAVHLAGALDLLVRLRGFLDEAAHLLFVVGVPFDGLEDEAVGRASGRLRERVDSRAQLRGQSNRGGVGHGDVQSKPVVLRL